MQKLYKQFAGWVTKWKAKRKFDEFFVARLRLTFYYSITAIVILGGSSVLLYDTILANFTQSIWQERRLDSALSQVIIDRTQDILLNRFLTIDLLLILLIVILGFLLTSKTLKPINSNMQKHKRFITDASHELRTPTAVIISGLEVSLSNKKLDFLSAKKTLENTLEEMREFSKLSNNLLDISKYDMPSNLEFKPVGINKLVKSVVKKSENLALTAKEIKFEIKLIDSEVVYAWPALSPTATLYDPVPD